MKFDEKLMKFDEKSPKIGQNWSRFTDKPRKKYPKNCIFQQNFPKIDPKSLKKWSKMMKKVCFLLEKLMKNV